MGLLKIARLQRADIASSPPHAAVAEYDRPISSRHPITADIRTHRRGATTLCRNPVRGAQQSVPGLDTLLLSACRRYATTASIPTQYQRRAYGVRGISPTQHQRRAHSVRSISLTQHQRRAHSVRSISPTQRQRRANGASETRYCIITPSARRDSGGRMGHRRSSITRRFADALLPQRRSMTARAVTSSVTPRQRRGTSADADAPRTRRWHSPAHLFENSVHLSHSFRIESGSRLVTASRSSGRA